MENIICKCGGKVTGDDDGHYICDKCEYLFVDYDEGGSEYEVAKKHFSEVDFFDPEGCYFCIYKPEEDEDDLHMAVVPISFWERENCLPDTGFPRSASFSEAMKKVSGGETMESIWEVNIDKDEAINFMIEFGFKQDEEFSDMMEE